MDIFFYTPVFDTDEWLPMLQKALPQARFHLWQTNQTLPQVDYALVWRPKPNMLAGQKKLKAIFALGAGVDAILDQLTDEPDLLPKNVPLYRLEDTGMARQMIEYTTASVMRYFRRLDEYQQLQRECNWQYLPPYEYDDFSIGVMGLGVLGSQVAMHLASLGFNVKGWSRSLKQIKSVTCYGYSQFEDFLCGTKLLINLLPSTPQTREILNISLFKKLAEGAYLINIARGKQLVEQDLLIALDNGLIKAATLDVFVKEPLAATHPFWQHNQITITPHISAMTKPIAASEQIIDKINRIEKGEIVLDGLVDIQKGY